MSKTLAATCNANVVLVDGLPLPATILSEGVAPSEGIVVLDESAAYYLAKTSPDLKTALEQTVAALAQAKTAFDTIATTLTSIGAGMTGGTTAPPGTLSTNVTTINTAATALDTARAALNTLKGALR